MPAAPIHSPAMPTRKLLFEDVESTPPANKFKRKIALTPVSKSDPRATFHHPAFAPDPNLSNPFAAAVAAADSGSPDLPAPKSVQGDQNASFKTGERDSGIVRKASDESDATKSSKRKLFDPGMVPDAIFRFGFSYRFTDLPGRKIENVPSIIRLCCLAYPWFNRCQ